MGGACSTNGRDFRHRPRVIITDFGEFDGSIPFAEFLFCNFFGKKIYILRKGLMEYLALKALLRI
jgi:hypothetical protein